MPRRTGWPASPSCRSRSRCCWRTCCASRTAARSRPTTSAPCVEWLKAKTSTRRDRLPPGARADAGLHRRAGRGRPRRHARRHAEPGRRPRQDQPAGAGRPRHRPLRAGRLLRHRRRLREERRDRVRAQQGALRVPALGRRRLQQLPRRAAGHRHLPPGQPRVPGADGVDQGRRQGRRRRSPTPASAPTATPPWSTRWACWAGAWAASRRRPPCSASRSPW